MCQILIQQLHSAVPIQITLHRVTQGKDREGPICNLGNDMVSIDVWEIWGWM